MADSKKIPTTNSQLPTTQLPLVVITGETASGKSALTMALAKKFNGEIICADSRTVYKGMDIGTAKPTKKEQTEVKHHLIDILEPDERFTVAQFKELANKAIIDINNRGKLPIMVGGTGLYIDAVVYDYQFNSDAARDPENPRHLLKTSQPTKNQLRPNTLVIGLEVESEELNKRIVSRVEGMFSQDLETEVKGLANRYGWDTEAMSAVGYKEFRPFFGGQQTNEQTKNLIVQHTLNYAKRQRTWFKRSISINHLSKMEEAVALVTTFLNK